MSQTASLIHVSRLHSRGSHFWLGFVTPFVRALAVDMPSSGAVEGDAYAEGASSESWLNEVEARLLESPEIGIVVVEGRLE